MPFELNTPLDIALAAVVLLTLVGFVLLTIGVILSTKRARNLVVEAWYVVSSTAESATTERRLLPASKLLGTLFENSSGFSRRKFILLMLAVNGAALVGRYLALEIEQTEIAVKLALENAGPSAGDDEGDEHAWFSIAAFLFAPLHLVAWSAFDLASYLLAKKTLRKAIQKNSAWPLAWLMVAVIFVSYCLPILFFFTNSGLLAFLANLTPLTPLLHAAIAAPLCWHCSALMLPAGLSVTLIVLVSTLVFSLLMNQWLLRVIARACELSESSKPERLIFWALNMITIAGGAVLLLTVSQLPWSPTQ